MKKGWARFPVSIPQGTIKSMRSRNKVIQRTLFQFHKVRLKERGVGNWCCNTYVSIPQGTIKRSSHPFTSRWPESVSIPQGTIKRRAVLHFDKLNYWFQFHKVRLKDPLSATTTWPTSVSIPQGTIKSQFFTPITWRDNHVSIPQGTIKSPQSVQARTAGLCFNSTRYD